MRDIGQSEIMSTLLNSGDVLRSRYRILHFLGFAGLSRTYLAEDLNRFNQRCVLKEFAPQLKQTSAQEKALELFEREAGVLYRLQHPQIPQFQQLFCYRRQEEGHLFLVQDYVAGVTYHDLLNQRLEASNRFSEGEIEQLLIQVLPILEYIHSIGVIHRDISPANLIFRNQDKLPVLIGFGCIEEVEIKTQSELSHAATNTSIPLVSKALGKAGYAPPEQLERGIVYAHSDLYALAATAVVLLTGKIPQKLINPHDYRWHWRHEVGFSEQSPVALSPKLEWILSTMLSPYPSDRFASAAEVSKILQEITSSTIQFTETTAVQNPDRQTSWNKVALIGDLLAKCLFFVPFTAVLILGGFLCLKAADLEVAPMVPSVNNSTTLDVQIQAQNR